MRRTNLSALISAVLGGSAGMIASSVSAQTGANIGIEEVVVTATRRATNVQDVPVAVTALTGESLDNQNIENVQDLTAVIPNVLIRGGAGGTSGTAINMRGIPNVGTYVDDVWQVSGAGLLQRQFVELDRVEVLRGPQGTLYGRDSTGGSIHLFTKRPATEFGADIKLGIGAFDRRDASVSVDLPFTQNFLSKWTVASYSKDGYVESLTTGRKSGNLEDKVVRGDLLWTPTERMTWRLTHQQDDGISTTARVQTFINYGVAYDKGYQVGLAEAYDIASRAVGGPGFTPESYVAGWPGGELGKYESRLTSRTPDRQTLKQDTLHFDYDITDRIALKYIYGGTDIDTTSYTDWGGSAYNFFVNYGLGRTEFDSNELQLSGDYSRIHWTAGGFQWDQKSRTRGVEWSMADWVQSVPAGVLQQYDYNDVLASAACTMTPADRGVADKWGASWPFPCDAAGGFGWVGIFAGTNSSNGIDGSDRANGAEQDGHALFGQVTFDLTDRWDLTVGYRYHKQTNTSYSLDLDAGYALGITEKRPIALDTEFSNFSRAVTAPVDYTTYQDVTFDKTSTRFATSYHINDDVMVYLGYSEGFNSGGFVPIEDSVGRYLFFYDPETIENKEIGLRSDLADGRVRLNATYFYTDWLDIQLAASVTDRATHLPITETATQNAASGLAKGLELEVTYAPTDRLLLAANLGFLDTAYKGIAAGAQITENTEFGGAPNETYDLSAQYTWDVGGGSLAARVQGNYWGSYWRSQVPSYRRDAYGSGKESGDFWLVNARVSYTPDEGNYQIDFWGNNLTNSYNINSGFMDYIWQFDFAGVDAPREVGVSMTMHF